MSNETNTIELGPKDALALMQQAFEVDEPVYLEGPRGIGKTELHYQLAERVGAIMHEPLILTNMEPMDLRGLVQVEDGVTTWAPPAFLPRTASKQRQIFFVDEIPNADSRMQTPLYQLFHDRRIGEHQLPAGTWVSGAGNTAADNAVLYEVQGPLLSRCLVVRMRVSHPDWDEWAATAEIAPEIRTFLKLSPEFLDASTMVHRNPDDRISPNPRAWGQSINRYIQRFGVQDNAQTKAFVAGKVGLAVAEEFMTTLREIIGIPPAEEILTLAARAVEQKDHTILTSRIPNKVGSLYGVVSSITRHSRKLPQFLNAMTTLNLLTEVEDGLPREDVRTMGMELLLKEIGRANLRAEVARSQPWKQYADKNLKEISNFTR